MCDWEKIDSTLTRIRNLPGGTANARPFLLLGVSDDPAEHLAAARTRAEFAMRGRVAPPPPPARQHDRIRVAYVSGDFGAHATSYLIAELFELHDRSAFEVYGVSFGPEDGSALRQRVLGALDGWLEGADRSDAEIAAWLREREIDIAVDLKGYTAFCRPGIFAYRPAPVQVSYLGYPGTMAAPFIDYVIADGEVIPDGEQGFYTEKIAHLPDSYQVNDRRRRIIDETPTRKEAGLPDDGFVFCCFNNSWKITAPVFDVWMRVLSSVPGSVLWLLEDNPWAAQNLRRAAVDRGVQPERLVFAPRTASELHLPRHRLAGLLLDTLPYNAHTTASDALWTALPVLTCTGRTFAARVAASLLSAAGLAQLVTSSLQEYEALAIELARSPARLAALRTRLTSNRESLPLFDTPRFCRHLEAAYRRMWLIHQQGNAPEAFTVDRIPDAADQPPPSLEQLYALAVGQQQAGQLEAAIETYARCLVLNPNLPEVHNNLGTALDAAGRLAEAVTRFERALALDPAYVRPLVNLGRVLRLQGNTAEALRHLERALALSPENPRALTNLGFALADLGRAQEATVVLRRALALEPNLAEAHHGLGRVLLEQSDAQGARDSLRRAVELRPDLAEAHALLAIALLALQQLPEALQVVERLLASRPEDGLALAIRLNCVLKMCDWNKVESTLARIRGVPGGTTNIHPFLLVGVSDDPAEHLAASQARAATATPGITPLPPRAVRQHDRIRVAYVSRDFFAHATAVLMAELPELHDRSTFEVFGVSYGPHDGSVLRRRVIGAFDEYLEGAGRSDAEIAAWIREREIDIVVDLKGHTDYSRPGIFARRPAPVQVSYLGFPGTLAAPFIDYLIADRNVIPEAAQAFYTEKIVYLPDSYQVNDRRRQIAERTPTRAESGLPDEGFVFCCFNNNWKIAAPVFDVWIRLLSSVPGSVLWLLQDNASAAQNLRQHAAERGVQPERLIFAPRIETASHLARHRLADLFLDTLPCNAHTTASDALWVGLPVLTCTGHSFAARVAASVVSAAGLSELVTSSLEEYEALALELSRVPGRLAALRAMLLSNREALPLFDTPRFCRHLEAAYRRMWLTQQQGQAPETFEVEGLSDGELR
jgi:predicted O-linked N-acetylglucosamine transferase (SPINDLY family)